MLPGEDFGWRRYAFKRVPDSQAWEGDVEGRMFRLTRTDLGEHGIIWAASSGARSATATQVDDKDGKRAGFNALDRLWDLIRP